MVLWVSVGAVICSIVASRNPVLKLQPWAVARFKSSSMTPVIIERTPTFSNSSV
jgi:hypothetical protein